MFEDAVERVLATEAGYVNNPNDSGGETIWGITAAVARENGYVGAMKDMTRAQAKAIYKRKYWDTLRLDEITRVSGMIAFELFDTGVNQGIGKAATFLQRSLNVFNMRGAWYPDLLVDGSIGPKTIEALRAFLSRRPKDGTVVMLRALNCMQGAFYIELAEKREKDEDFVYGWLLHRVVI